MSFPHGCRIEFDIDVGLNAMVLHFPLALKAVERSTRRGYRAAVNQLGIVINSNQSSPGIFSNKGPDPSLAEIPGQGVATRTRKLINDHHLGAIDRSQRTGKFPTLTSGNPAHYR